MSQDLPEFDVAIRPAIEADLPEITRIYAHAVLNGTASYEYDASSLVQMTGRFEALKASGFPYLAAEVDGAVAGYAYAGPFRTRPAYRFIVEDSIYIAPEAQGRGVGRLLLQQLIRDCTTLGFRQMIAVIGDGGVNLPSVKLHSAHGFSECGRIIGSGYKFGRWCDTVLMQLAMNGGAGLAPDADALGERNFQVARR
ncbi:MAG: N-acetyltransferase family protein [Hyphomonadaceae bacterium]|nr:N-acetyltransferase family protein [Hyphomonadaceae bacterium]